MISRIVTCMIEGGEARGLSDRETDMSPDPHHANHLQNKTPEIAVGPLEKGWSNPIILPGRHASKNTFAVRD